MRRNNPRMVRDSRTIEVMIGLYCRDHHKSPNLCPECQNLRDYAQKRLEKCPFQEGKTVCSKCPVHCYKPEMRQKVRTVMRFSGPRMIYCHPAMAIRHIFDSRRKKPLTRP